MKKHECDTCNATDESQRHNRVKKVRHEKQKVQQGQTDPWEQRSEARSPLGGGREGAEHRISLWLELGGGTEHHLG